MIFCQTCYYTTLKICLLILIKQTMVKPTLKLTATATCNEFGTVGKCRGLRYFPAGLRSFYPFGPPLVGSFPSIFFHYHGDKYAAMARSHYFLRSLPFPSGRSSPEPSLSAASPTHLNTLRPLPVSDRDHPPANVTGGTPITHPTPLVDAHRPFVTDPDGRAAWSVTVSERPRPRGADAEAARYRRTRAKKKNRPRSASTR